MINLKIGYSSHLNLMAINVTDESIIRQLLMHSLVKYLAAITTSYIREHDIVLCI